MSGTTLDLETLPFPVAYPLSYARDESLGASDRVDNVFFAGYQAVRTTALLLLADYLESSETCPRVSEAIRGLRLPHWKEWVDLATTLTKFWRGDYDQKPERETHFPSLVTAWLETAYPRRPRTDGDWPTLLKGLPGGHGPAKGPVDALWHARNTRTHGTGTRTGDPKRDADLLFRLLPVLQALTAGLFPPDAFTLMRRVSESDAEGLRVIRLQGPHRDRRFEAEEIGEEWTSVFETTGIAVLAEGEAVVVHPLFLPPGPDLAGLPVDGGGLLEDLYLVDRVSERKVVALGVLDERRLPERLIADVTAALRRKQVEFGLDRDATRRWNLVDWSASTAGRLLGDLTNRKYFPDFYYERPDVDATLRRTLGLDGAEETSAFTVRGQAVLLLGEAGSGKSSLLCRFIDGFLRKQAKGDDEAEEKRKDSRGKGRGKLAGSADLSRYLEGRGGGDVVLYLSGAAAYGGDAGKGADALLCDAVVRQGGVLTGAFGTLEHFVTKLDESAAKTGPNADHNPDRKVWIVLDGINEADRFKDLVGALDRFLPHLAQRPWLRLLVSIRSGAYHELERKDRDAMVHEGAVFRNASCWASFPSDRPDAFGRKQDVPYLETRPFAAGREGAEAYRLRQAWQGGRSSEIRYEDLPQGVRALLLSPLHLHLFHETWAGQARVPVDLDEMGLFEAFLTKLTSEHPGLEERLQLLAEVMLERREALLPIEVAEKWEESGYQAESMATRHAKLTPVEELVAASILMRPVEEGQGSQRRLIGYRFSHQSLASAVLARFLRARLAGRAVPTAEELLNWAREATGEGTGGQEPFAELVDALGTYVVACTKAGDGVAVATMLDLENEDVRHQFFGIALLECERIRGSRVQRSETESRFFETLTLGTEKPVRKRRLASACNKAHWVLFWAGAGPVAEEISRVLHRVLLELLSEEPEQAEWKRDLAGHLQRLGGLMIASGRSDEALRYAGEDLRLRREIVNAEPDALEWKRDLAVSMGRFAGLAASRGGTKEAMSGYEENVRLMREVVAAAPDRIDWLRDMAVALTQFTFSLSASSRAAEALGTGEEAVRVMRHVVSADPARLDWNVDLMLALPSVGRSLTRLGRADEALLLAEESVRVGRQVVAAAPSRHDWKRHLSFSLHELSDLLQAGGQSDEALRAAEESLKLNREVVGAAPTRTDWKRDLAGSLYQQMGLLAAAGRFDDAGCLAEECLAIMRGLVAAEPERLDWMTHLTVLLDRVIELREKAGRESETESLVRECLAVRRALAAANPKRLGWKWDLTEALDRLSDLREEAGDQNEAERLAEESLRVMQEIAAADPQTLRWKQDLTVSLGRLSALRRTAGDWLGAERLAKESLTVMRGLIVEEPTNLETRRDLALALSELSDLSAVGGMVLEATRLSEESLSLFVGLVAAEPGQSSRMRDLAASLNRLVELHLLSGERGLANSTAEESVVLRRGLCHEDESNPESAYSLVVGLNSLSRVLLDYGRPEGARERILEAEDLWSRLPELFRTTPHARLEEARMAAIRTLLEPNDPTNVQKLEEAFRIVKEHTELGKTAFKVFCVGKYLRMAEEVVMAEKGGTRATGTTEQSDH